MGKDVDKYHLLLILEGDEEEMFFSLVKTIATSDDINLSLKNACTFGRIAPLFQEAISDDYDCVLCIYDVDYRQNEKNSPYSIVRKKLSEVVGPNDVDKISFCTNPNILQIILLCCDSLSNVSLKVSSKSENTPIVHRYWDKIGRECKDKEGHKTSPCYDAKKWQLDIIKNSFLYDDDKQKKYNYENIFINGPKLSTDYLMKNQPGSNILSLLEAIKTGNLSFFRKISKTINKPDKYN